MHTVLKAVKLFLPVLIPSWRFFDTIAPSPRIAFTLLQAAHDVVENWQEFRPRPANLSLGSMLFRLFWNPRWNETLFLASCAERLMENADEQSSREPLRGLGNHLRDLLCADSWLAARAWRILQQTVHAKFDKSAAPESRHARRHMHPFRNLLILQPFCGQQHNPATLGYTQWYSSSPHQLIQLRPCCRTQLDRWRYALARHLCSMR